MTLPRLPTALATNTSSSRTPTYVKNDSLHDKLHDYHVSIDSIRYKNYSKLSVGYTRYSSFWCLVILDYSLEGKRDDDKNKRLHL